VRISRVRHLVCPKCGASFDYEYVPGASATAIRLGTKRYMRCPVCHRFSMFPMVGPEPAGRLPTEGQSSTPRYSDARLTAQWVALVLAPLIAATLVVLLFLPRPEPALWVAFVLIAVILIVSVVGLVRLRLHATTSP
jgi:hypothetical protein